MSFQDWGIFQHVGPNRSGKSMSMAIEAWKAYRRGIEVYANCSTNPFTGQVEHILNFHHTDYVPGELMQLGLRSVYVMTDQPEQLMDVTVMTKAVGQMRYFGYQAKNGLLEGHYDNVL